MSASIEIVEVEVWVLVDEEGEYEIAKDPSDLQAGPGLASRMVKLTVTVPTPKPVALVATVPAEPEGGTLTVA